MHRTLAEPTLDAIWPIWRIDVEGKRGGAGLPVVGRRTREHSKAHEDLC